MFPTRLSSHFISLWAWACTYALGAFGQVALPIIHDPSFSLLSGETIVRSQLALWGIHLDVGLDLDLDLNKGVHVDLSASANLGVRDLDLDQASCSLEEKRLLGINLNLGLGTSPTNSKSGTSANANVKTGFDSGTGVLGTGLGLDIGADVGGTGWGQADNVAKGGQGDTEWITYISIGWPPRSMPVLPDTGSSDLFLFSSSCSSCYLANHTSFNPSASSTFKNLSVKWDIEYTDGSGARGWVGYDNLAFGSTDNIGNIGGGGGVGVNVGLGAGGETLGTDLAFAVAESISGSGYLHSTRSGVLGLGLDGLSQMPKAYTTNGATLFSRLVAGKKVALNVLSIRLVKGVQRQGVVSKEGEGRYTLGGIEDAYIAGGRQGLTWAPVSSRNYWGIILDNVELGRKSIIAQGDITMHRAIIDTGTTLIITSDAISTAFHSLIPQSFKSPSSGIWYIPCTATYPTTPNLFFTISGTRFGIPIEDLAWKVSTTFPNMCVSGLQGGMPYFTVLGDMFIKNHYVVLGYGSSKLDGVQVGIGKRVDVPTVF